MQKAFNVLLSGLLLLATLLWLSSYTHHSSIGIDHDFEKQDRILHKFYRVNWNGHGSILLGYGSVWKAVDKTKPLEKFDPASALLKPVKKPLESNFYWNSVGFWYINSPSPRPTFWIGIPSWLPVLGLALILIILLRSTKR